MADAELRQIGHDPHRVVEGEILVELQAVGRARRRRGKRARPRLRSASLRRERSGEPREVAVRARRSPSMSVPSRRFQFGWPWSGPGRFAWFSSPAASSSWSPTSADGRSREVAHHRLERRLVRRLRTGQEPFGGERLGEPMELRRRGRRAPGSAVLAVVARRASGAGRCRGPATSRGRSAGRGS